MATVIPRGAAKVAVNSSGIRARRIIGRGVFLATDAGQTPLEACAWGGRAEGEGLWIFCCCPYWQYYNFV